MTGGPADVAAVVTTCPSCGSPVVAGERFCETCGADLDGPVAAAPPGGDGLAGSPSRSAPYPVPPRAPVREGVAVVDADLSAVPALCGACGGRVAPDGYCEECGTPARRPRDHWADRPAGWVAMVCDRGIRHSRNEDAGAVAATAQQGGYAALVVCDGVSSAVDSDVASLAAARAARDVLAAVPAPPPDGGTAAADAADAAPAAAPDAASGRTAASAGTPTMEVSVDGGTPPGSRARVLEDALRTATAAAHRRAAAAARDPHEPNPPSCTFVAAVLEGSTLLVGWVGDSRAYWLPDSTASGPPEQLSVDDSWAAESMAHGMSREEAESGPHAHAITRWLGVDAPDPVPRTTARRLDGPGWLLVCSDGLWNYCSAAPALRELVTATVAGLARRPEGATQARPAGEAAESALDLPTGPPAQAWPDPEVVAEELVAWANRQGGHDNITVALARVG